MIHTHKQKRISILLDNIKRLRDEQNQLFLALIGALTMDNITITDDDFKKLQKAYKKAVAEGKESFIFHFSLAGDRELVTNYAKYLIEYLKGVKK
jgi:hypothetical protein